ncbi:unnamed protein product [Polarella glacialis]|uniref:Uncharacterized protein n=2 Tax=Polarella glacialis TaxID=89957 RepID=A0A813L5X5_POLGL|nr:unnamed protein product [Polarella glacialis]
MMRHSAMGRQAEMGPSWCPSGLVSRRLAEALMDRGGGKAQTMPAPLNAEATEYSLASSLRSTQASPTAAAPQNLIESPAHFLPSRSMTPRLPPQPPRQRTVPPISSVPLVNVSGAAESSRPETRRPPAAALGTPRRAATPGGMGDQHGTEVTPRPVSQIAFSRGLPSDEAPHSARLPLRGARASPVPEPRLDSAPMSARGVSSVGFHQLPQQISRPTSANVGSRPGSTVHWRPSETSLSRNSFNSIVAQTPLDVTEVMMRNASMGRQAEMGPDWCPGGLASRKMAAALTTTAKSGSQTARKEGW